MKRSKRNHSPEFKANIALEAIRGRYAVKELAGTHQLNPSLVHAWRQNLAEAAPAVFTERGAPKDKQAAQTIKALDRRLAELKAEQEWMRRAVAALALRDKRACIDTENAELSILSQARLLGLHRSGIYYQKRRDDHAQHEDEQVTETQTTDADSARDGHGASTLSETSF